MWCPMMPDCEWVTTTAPPSLSTSAARFWGVQVLAGERFIGSHVLHVEPGGPARAADHALKVEVEAAGSSGSASYGFNADGFGPQCDPNRTPNFSKTKVRLPAK